MIKFFRKIRHQLVQDGKTPKYFRYAIGEIVLVVIGILIALSINNWNENQKTQRKANQFLSSLKVDLETDLKAIDFVINEQTNRFTHINQIIKLSTHPKISEIIKADTLKFSKAGRNFTFFPVIGAYKAASNSGLIDKVEPENLKNAILNLYEHLYIRINYNGQLNDSRYELVDWESRAYIDYTKKELAFDNMGLLDKDFVNQIGYLNRFINVYIERAKDTRLAIKTILKQIEENQ